MNPCFNQFPMTLEARLEELQQARESLIQVAELAPEDDGLTGRDPDKWSVAEIVFHLHLVEKRTAAGLKRALELQTRSAPAEETFLRTEWERVRSVVGTRKVLVRAPLRVVPTNAPKRSDALALIRQSRQELLAAIQAATYQDLICISMPHPFEVVGVLTGAGWLSVTAFHDLRHAQQIREKSPA